MIEAPEVWRTFGSYIYQDFFAIHQDFHEGILLALQGLNSSEKIALLEFVNTILLDSPKNQSLIDLWVASGASDVLVSNQMAVIYKALLEVIEESIGKDHA